MENLLSRKFILAVLILIAGLVLTAIGNCSYEQFLELAKWIMGMYVVGNVVAKFSDTDNQ